MNFARNLGALSSEVSDVYVILTRNSDLAIWNRAPVIPRVQPLVLADWVPEEAIITAIKEKSMPTFKKWMGLQRVYKDYAGDRRYKYMICCDCEVRVIKPIDANFISNLPSQFLAVGDHFAGRTQGWESLVRTANSRDPPSEIILSSCYNNLYTWWSALPIYDVATLDQFLLHVGTQDPLALARWLRYEVFDHMLYQRFIILRSLCGARYICLTHDLHAPNGWSLESHETSLMVFEATRKAGLRTVWISNQVARRVPAAVCADTYLMYHLDRR